MIDVKGKPVTAAGKAFGDRIHNIRRITRGGMVSA